MIIVKHITDLNSQLNNLRDTGLSIGFVPTMGALHDGHISLLQKSKIESDITISSIFINPTQFNNAEDFKKYPVKIESDIYKLEKTGCDILFLPELNEIYPLDKIEKKHFEIGNLETILEGKFRPGHFQGVCQVVSRLLNIVEPDILFLGQKDFQQCLVIKKLIALENFKTKIIICPTARESNGLAMSSRNLRLNATEKIIGSEIFTVLQHIQNNLKTKTPEQLKEISVKYLIEKNIKPEYVEIANSENLNSVDDWDQSNNLVALVAAFVGEVRLIDNILLKK